MRVRTGHAFGWADVGELELATLSWVHWFNHDRLHGHCGDIPPAEYEADWAHTQSSGNGGNGGADHAVPVAGS